MAELEASRVGAEAQLSNDQTGATRIIQQLPCEHLPKFDSDMALAGKVQNVLSALLDSKVSADESSTKTTSSRRPSLLDQLSATDRDMMEFSPRGDVKGVRYEDEKGLGGCRIQ